MNSRSDRILEYKETVKGTMKFSVQCSMSENEKSVAIILSSWLIIVRRVPTIRAVFMEPMMCFFIIKKIKRQALPIKLQLKGTIFSNDHLLLPDF